MKQLVLLVLILLAMPGCTKDRETSGPETVPLRIKYLSRIQGTWTFMNMKRNWTSSGSDTTYGMDTTLLVQRLSDSTLRALDRTLTYLDTSFGYYLPVDISRYLLFADKSSTTHHTGTYVQYFYKSDSLIIAYWWQGLGGGQKTYYIRKN